MLQELWLKGKRPAPVAGWAAGRQCNMSAEPGWSTGPGPTEVSAGAADALSSEQGPEAPGGMRLKAGGRRVGIRRAHVGLPGGVLYIIIHLQHGLERQGANAEIQGAVEGVLTSEARAVVLQRDFHAEPEELGEPQAAAGPQSNRLEGHSLTVAEVRADDALLAADCAGEQGAVGEDWPHGSPGGLSMDIDPAGEELPQRSRDTFGEGAAPALEGVSWPTGSPARARHPAAGPMGAGSAGSAAPGVRGRGEDSNRPPAWAAPLRSISQAAGQRPGGTDEPQGAGLPSAAGPSTGRRRSAAETRQPGWLASRTLGTRRARGRHRAPARLRAGAPARIQAARAPLGDAMALVQDGDAASGSDGSGEGAPAGEEAGASQPSAAPTEHTALNTTAEEEVHDEMLGLLAEQPIPLDGLVQEEQGAFDYLGPFRRGELGRSEVDFSGATVPALRGALRALLRASGRSAEAAARHRGAVMALAEALERAVGVGDLLRWACITGAADARRVAAEGDGHGAPRLGPGSYRQGGASASSGPGQGPAMAISGEGARSRSPRFGPTVALLRAGPTDEELRERDRRIHARISAHIEAVAAGTAVDSPDTPESEDPVDWMVSSPPEAVGPTEEAEESASVRAISGEGGTEEEDAREDSESVAAEPGQQDAATGSGLAASRANPPPSDSESLLQLGIARPGSGQASWLFLGPGEGHPGALGPAGVSAKPESRRRREPEAQAGAWAWGTAALKGAARPPGPVRAVLGMAIPQAAPAPMEPTAHPQGRGAGQAAAPVEPAAVAWRGHPAAARCPARRRCCGAETTQRAWEAAAAGLTSTPAPEPARQPVAYPAEARAEAAGPPGAREGREGPPPRVPQRTVAKAALTPAERGIVAGAAMHTREAQREAEAATECRAALAAGHGQLQVAAAPAQTRQETLEPPDGVAFLSRAGVGDEAGIKQRAAAERQRRSQRQGALDVHDEEDFYFGHAGVLDEDA